MKVYEKSLERIDIDSLLNDMEIQYEALLPKDRMYKGTEKTWEDLVQALPCVPELASEIGFLTEPQIYFLNQKGQLVKIAAIRFTFF